VDQDRTTSVAVALFAKVKLCSPVEHVKFEDESAQAGPQGRIPR